MKHNIAVAQINSTVGDLYGNGQRILESIEQAKQQGADIVVFPEQVVTGYPAQDLLLHEDFVADTEYVNKELVKRVHGITAVIGTIERAERGTNGKTLHNTALVVQDGKVIGKQAKTHLPTYDVFHEHRYFTPATSVAPVEIDGVNYGIHICEDMWSDLYTRNICNELAEQGADVLVNLSASPFYLGKQAVRMNIARDHVRNTGLPFLYVNSVGGQDELIFDGRSFFLDESGGVQWSGDFLEERVARLDEQFVAERFGKEEAAFRALSFGLKDYLAKNGREKVVLGLSGGIDSALTAAIAVEAVGAENVLGISMPSSFSSDHSKSDAYLLAKNLGIQIDTVPIAGMYDAAITALEPMLRGTTFDVTEENIQARSRMVALMAYANKHGHCMLSTGDKSESALGYCTIYGDMSGAVSVINDLTKPEVYDVSQWYNEHKRSRIIPRRTLEKPPSPELKPGQVAPFDYERLSPLLEGITDRKSVEELTHDGYTRKEIHSMYKKWKRAEFKRWQAPIALKCKATSFGAGRLYPVTNHYTPRALFTALPPLEATKSRQVELPSQQYNEDKTHQVLVS